MKKSANNKKNFSRNQSAAEKFKRNDRMDKGQTRSAPNRQGAYALSDQQRTSSLNDISWYNRYPELLQATSRIAFPYRPGMSINMGKVPNMSVTNSNSYTLPGVATMFWVPAFARSNKATDPMSIAAREIYAKVRSKFSSSLDADAPDFIMYLGALDSIFAYIGALKRIYRVLDVYSPNNYVLPDGLMNGLNIAQSTVQALRMNKADFNFAINQLVRMSRKFVLPATMDLFNRHYWMNDNVYADAPSVSSQFYVFVQAGFYKYAPLNTPDNVAAAGLTLQAAPWGSITEWVSDNPVKDLYEYGANLIDTLSAWDDSYTISGYLMRAYESTTQFVVDELPIDTTFDVAYVPEVLSQIHNSHGILATDRMDISNLKTTDVTQDPKTNAILYNPTVDVNHTSFGTDYASANVCINLADDVPSPEAVVIATRLNACLGNVNPDGKYPIICGTEIPMGWTVSVPTITEAKPVYAQYGLDQENKVYFEAAASNIDYSTTQLYADMVKDAIEAFDWHPMVRVTYLYNLSGGKSNNVVFMRGDVRNLTTVDRTTLENIHRVCTYSEFNSFSE